MRNHRFGLAAAALSLGLGAGCAEHPDAGRALAVGLGTIAGAVVGAQIGGGSTRAAASAVGGVVGGVAGLVIADELTKADRERAYEAQSAALELPPGEGPVRWRNPDSGRSGHVTAADYDAPESDAEAGAAQCRSFAHYVADAGPEPVATGRACRSADGSWRVVETGPQRSSSSAASSSS